MGSIFSSSHRFSLDAPIKDVQRTSGTLKSKSKSISAKSSRRVASREREKQRKSKEEERRKKERKRREKRKKKLNQSMISMETEYIAKVNNDYTD